MIFLMWYLIGVFVAFIFLIVGNTISVRVNEGKAKLKLIFFSWLIAIVFIAMIVDIICDKYKPFSKIIDFFNQEPELTRKK